MFCTLWEANGPQLSPIRQGNPIASFKSESDSSSSAYHTSILSCQERASLLPALR
jgi:hypothetical protein